ncbi:MAG: MFS transporter [Blastocatellales bacterium]
MKRCPACQRDFTDNYSFCDQDGTTLVGVTEIEARLTIRQTDGQTREVLLPPRPLSIGKNPDNDIVITDGAISRRHLSVEKRNDKCFIKDLGSLNGTSVNGKKIGGEELELKDGDEIGVGRTKISFHLAPAQAVDLKKTTDEDVPRLTMTIQAVSPPTVHQTTKPPEPGFVPPPPSPPRLTALSVDPSEIQPGNETESDLHKSAPPLRVSQTGELTAAAAPTAKPKDGDRALKQNILLDGRYELTAILDQDENGTLYRARRLMLGDEVSIRVLRPELVADQVAVERFRRQALVAARIKHPNSVQVFDFGYSPEGAAYIVEESLTGQTLRDLINKERTLSLTHAVSLMSQICGAVHAAHVNGIILRGLKPETIFIEHDKDENEIAKVGGYGLAKVDDDFLRGIGGKALTGKLGLFGSPQYTSPEQWQHKHLDARSDVYALGVILFEMLTGEPPFNPADPGEFAAQHLQAPVPELADFGRSDLDEEINAIITRALAKEPEGRQVSALQLAEELQAVTGARGGLVSRLTGLLPATLIPVSKPAVIATGEVSLPSVLPRPKTVGHGAFNPIVLALMAEAFLSRLSSGLIKTAVPLYALLVFGMDITSVMGLVLIQNVVPLLMRPLFGTLADKYGKKKVFLISLSIRTLVSVLYAVATLPLLFLISAIRGIADSAKGPSASAMIADHTDEKNIAQAYSWYTTTKSTSGGIGEALAAFVLVFLLTIYAGMSTAKVNVAVMDKVTRSGSNAEEIVKDASQLSVGQPLPGNENDANAHKVIRIEQREMKLSQIPIEDLPKVVDAAPLKKALVMIFIASTVLSLFSLILVAIFIKEKKKEKKDKKDKKDKTAGKTSMLEAAEKPPNVWAFALLGTALTAPAYMVTGEFFTILAVKLEVTPGALGWIKIVSETAVPLLFGPFFGWLADRIGASKVIALRSIANLLTSALFWIVPWFAGTALLGIAMGFARAVDEVGKAAFKPTWGAIAAKVSSFNLSARSRTMGILEGGVDASDLAFPVIAGVMLQYLSLGPLMLVRGILAIVAEIYGFLLMRKYKI